MLQIENQIKGFSTKKLKEIIEIQVNAYNSTFIDYIKDELIRRGEDFNHNGDSINEISNFSDEELKELVELDYNDHHLEYIEIARKEYLRRGFQNKIIPENDKNERFEKRFPGLRTIAGIITFVAWMVLLLTVIGSYIQFESIPDVAGAAGIILPILTLIVGIFIFIVLLSLAEIIKVILDIEENTRKYSDYYSNIQIENESEDEE